MLEVPYPAVTSISMPFTCRVATGTAAESRMRPGTDAVSTS
jgi:hypothetical protein